MALPEERWIQRLDNYANAFAVLENAYNISKERELTDLERMGLIKAFEFAFELAWNLMKDYLHYQGIVDIMGSRDAIRNAFKYEIIDNGEVWMDMIDRRNETSHAYDEEIAIRVVTNVSSSYINEMKKLLDTMRKYKTEYKDA